jgi:hypothetical protein
MPNIPFKVDDRNTNLNFGALETWSGKTDRKTAHISDEGGFVTYLTNKTGAPSVKGTLVSASTTTDNAFGLQSNEYDAFGVVYESGIQDGDICPIVVSGIASVLLKDGVAVTRSMFVVAADTDGRANVVANPGSGLPATDLHFKECGHFIESKAAGTNVLAKAVIHFN